MTAWDDLAALRSVVAGLTAPRVEFVAFYEKFLATEGPRAPAGEPPWPKSFMHAAFVAEQSLGRAGPAPAGQAPPNASDARDAAALALLALKSTETRTSAVFCAIAAGLYAARPGASQHDIESAEWKTSEAIKAAFGEDSTGAAMKRSGLERSTDPQATFVDPDRLGPAILRVQHRLCRIDTVDQNGNPTHGTGFLIGPSAVLTNWHIVSALSPKLDGKKLAVTFDYSRSTGTEYVVDARDDWCLGKSPTGDEEPAGAPARWWMDEARRAAWRDGLSDALDFAVIHLVGAPGKQRGWYDLPDTNIQPTGSCIVMHHPGGGARVMTQGSFCLTTGGGAWRSFHTATTTHGSSGGLVLNDRGEPIALHYLGLGEDALANPAAQPPNDVVNVAIPLGAIAARLGKDKLNEIATFDGGFNLARGCIGAGRPVFGRRKLLETLSLLVKGDKRILQVKVPIPSAFEKPGKSFTVDILQALLPQDFVLKIEAHEVKGSGMDMAAMILGRIAPSAAAEIRQTPLTSEAAHDQVLVNAMRDIIAQRWPNAMIWLVLDDLDKHDIADASGRKFLDTLYNRIAQIPQLRIVLIGLRAPLSGIIASTDLVDDIIEDDIKKVGDLFREWLGERSARGRPIPKEVVDAMAAVVQSYADKQTTPLATLGAFAIDHLNGPLRKLLDGGEGG